MRTVRMTLDDDLVEQVDRLAKKLGTSRSAVARQALRKSIPNLIESLTESEIARLEQKHRLGYEKYPVGKDEFSIWEKEQAWGDE